MTNNFHPFSTNRTIAPRLFSTISNFLNIAPHRLSAHTHFFDDLYLDPMDMTLLIAEMESKMGVYLSPEEVSSIETIADANQLLQQRVVVAA